MRKETETHTFEPGLLVQIMDVSDADFGPCVVCRRYAEIPGWVNGETTR